ncbi:hypothetical protein COCOBI_02-5130 [Coccomyxa sp. Obi]|nr:hypothetical protein COCOBI_02-5130 [Coccomyxa sp. Obi]
MILRSGQPALALGAGSGHSHSDFVLPNLGADIRKQWLQSHRSACTASPAAAYASARESRSSRGPASQWLDSALHEPQQHLELLGLAASDERAEAELSNLAGSSQETGQHHRHLPIVALRLAARTIGGASR